MRSKPSTSVRWIGLAVVLTAILTLLTMQSSSQAIGEKAAPTSPSAFLTTLGFKFEGSASCSASKCHGAETSVNKKNLWGNEFTLWHGRKDPHHTAFRTLVSPKAKAIATELKIPAAMKSDRCLNCHSTLATGPAGADLKGQEYVAAEGVSCNSCHGPSQKYREPHSTVDWIDGQRAKLNHGALLTTFGIYDTVPVLERAARCTSCHLAIEPELVTAGHPQPTFEMNHFSNIYADRHWHDPAGTFPAELWAGGQLAELHDALHQVYLHASSKSPTAAEEFKKAYAQALSHFSVLETLFITNVVPATDGVALHAEMEKLAGAAVAKDMATAAAASLAGAEQCQAKGLTAAVAKFKPDKAAATKVIGAIAAAKIWKSYGARGQEQQAYAIEALAQASGNDAVVKAVAPILPPKPGDMVKQEDFVKGLAAVQASLK